MCICLYSLYPTECTSIDVTLTRHSHVKENVQSISHLYPSGCTSGIYFALNHSPTPGAASHTRFFFRIITKQHQTWRIAVGHHAWCKPELDVRLGIEPIFFFNLNSKTYNSMILRQVSLLSYSLAFTVRPYFQDALVSYARASPPIKMFLMLSWVSRTYINKTTPRIPASHGFSGYVKKTSWFYSNSRLNLFIRTHIYIIMSSFFKGVKEWWDFSRGLIWFPSW